MAANPSNAEAVQLVQEHFLRHSDLIRGFIRSLMADRSCADDVYQETFLIITRKASDFKAGTSFPKWACTIARFKVLEARRSMRRGILLLSEDVIEALAVTEGAMRPDPRLDRLEECRRALPPTMRKALDLRYEGEHSPPEIARHMGWKTEAIYVALSRARSLLRACISKEAEA